jgi:parallel beta-helix repeat protein
MRIVKPTFLPLFAASLLSVVTFNAQTALGLPLYDGFAYTAGNLGAAAGTGGWDAGSFSTVTVIAGNLNGPEGLPLSTGSMLQLSKGTGSNFITFANSGQFTTGQVYFSFLFKPGNASGASSTGLDIAALSAQDASTSAINVQLRNNSGFKIGIKKAGGTAVFPSSTLAAGTPYLVVGKYDYSTSPHTGSLWVLTTCPTNEAAAGVATVLINTGTDFAAASGIGRFYLNGAGVPTAAVNVDELRVGNTWADVIANTTSQPPAVISAPFITQVQHTGAQIILRGTNGAAGGSYEVISTSNLVLPPSQWMAIVTNNFSGAGAFEVTNPVDASAVQQFYRLRVGGSGSPTNPPANTPPTIHTQPQNQTVTVGGSAVFGVAASGSAPLSYQWFFTNAASTGATNSSLTLTSVTTNQAGNYFVRVANDYGAATSSVVTLTVNPAPTGAAYYVSTTGSDDNPGTLAAPFATVSKAQSVMAVGDTIFLRGGSYNLSAQVKLTLDGTAANYCKLWAYPGEQPVFDFSTTPGGTKGLYLNADYWHVKGIEVANARDNGIIVAGASHCIIEGCVVHDCNNDGIRLGSSTLTASYTLILNCDSYRNYQAAAHGNNGDGFSAKDGTGPGNVFRGCRAWHNSDDGWDFYNNDITILLEDCITYANGLNLWGDSAFDGNGNGFKLGGASTYAQHILKNCLAIQNVHDGFDQNYNHAGVTLYNCTAYGNGVNFQFPDTPSVGVDVIKNCVAFSGVNAINAAAQLTSNSWQGFTVTAADFAGLDTGSVTNARNADYSLPVLPLLRLASSSDLIDAGVDVGIPFIGTAPDLGAYEYAP